MHSCHTPVLRNNQKLKNKNQTDGQCIQDPIGILILESIVKISKHWGKLIFEYNSFKDPCKYKNKF
mgnify:CR=1 FL=1